MILLTQTPTNDLNKKTRKRTKLEKTIILSKKPKLEKYFSRLNGNLKESGSIRIAIYGPIIPIPNKSIAEATKK